MKNVKVILAGSCVVAAVSLFLSMDGCEGGYYSRNDGRYVRENDREYRHYYRDGRWYRHEPSGVDVVVSALVAGALIEALPPQHTTVVIEGARYYHDDNYYYKPAPRGGYVVVPEPVQKNSRSQGDNRNDNNRGEHH